MCVNLQYLLLFLSLIACPYCGQVAKAGEHTHWRNEVQNSSIEQVPMDKGLVILAYVTSGTSKLYYRPSTEILNESGISVTDAEELPICGIRGDMYRIVYRGNQYYIPKYSVWLKNSSDENLLRFSTVQLRQLIRNSYDYDRSLYSALAKKERDYEDYCREMGVGIIEAYQKVNSSGMTDYYITIYNPTNSPMKEVAVKIMGVDGSQSPIMMGNGNYESWYKTYPVDPLSEKGTKFEYVWNNSSIDKVFISELKVKYKGRKSVKVDDPQSLVMPEDVYSYINSQQGGKVANQDDFMDDEGINRSLLSDGKIKNVNNRYLNFDEDVVSMVDTPPKFIGGINAIYAALMPCVNQDYFRKFPDGTRKTVLHAIISKDGQICNIRFDDIDNHGEMANSMKKALYELPDWIPATYRKEPVNYQVDIHLCFNIYVKDGVKYAQCFGKHGNVEFVVK